MEGNTMLHRLTAVRMESGEQIADGSRYGEFAC